MPAGHDEAHEHSQVSAFWTMAAGQPLVQEQVQSAFWTLPAAHS